MFFLGTYLDYMYFSLSFVAIVHLLWRQEGVGIYYEFIPDWIESSPARILFAAQYRTKFEILIREVFRK